MNCNNSSIMNIVIRPLAFAIPFVLAAVASAVPPSLHVQGNRVLDSANGQVNLRGVNCATLEWSTDGEGHILETVAVALKDWHCNILRIPLSQDRWFGKAPGQTDAGKSYRALVAQVVAKCSKANAYAMLDLHWNDCGVWGKNIGQHVMPDMYSATFWRSCAGVYKNNPAVLFDLYNETHDTTWAIWKDGGTITEKTGVGARQGPFVPVTYKTPGMQTLLDTIRRTGAKNVAVVGGLDWAYDLSGFSKGFALRDQGGRGIIYACHAYPFKGDTPEQFLTKLDSALPKFPVIISEFGSTPANKADLAKPDPWIVRIMDELGRRKCHFTAWDLHPSAGPTLISDWKYTPTPSFGTIVKSALSNSAPGH